MGVHPEIAKVASETGHTVETVRLRGTSFCKKNPITPRGEFHLAQPPAPEDFDQTLCERDHAAEAAAHGRDPDELETKLRGEIAALPRREMSVSIRRDVAPEGVQFVAIACGKAAFLSPVLSIEDADEEEHRMRAAAFAYAEAMIDRAA